MNITHSMKSPARLASRDVGLESHGNGKGDKSRISDLAVFKRNYEEIDWTTSDNRLRPTWFRGYKQIITY
jgi:hypothetical protein